MISGSSDCTIKFWKIPQLECSYGDNNNYYNMAQNIDAFYTYNAKYPVLKIVIIDENHLLVLKYVNTLEILKINFKD